MEVKFKVDVSVDYYEDVKKMVEFLFASRDIHKMNDTVVPIECRMGRYMLGRQTGHTTTMMKIAREHRAQGKCVLCLHANKRTADEYKRRDSNIIHASIRDSSELHGISPDLVLIDTSTYIGKIDIFDKLCYIDRHSKGAIYFLFQ